MGIKGLYNEIGPGTRIALSRLAIETFEQAGRPFRLAVDASIWQFQTQSGKGGKNPALRTFYYRLLRLLSLAIQPLLVFDGPRKPAFKRGRPTNPHVHPLANAQAKQLLALLGIPHHDAPGEAEAECALLQRSGIVDAVLSEDVDTLMFGCRLMLRNWSAESVRAGKAPTHVSLYRPGRRGEAGGANCDLTAEGMLLVALMSGGDYNPAGLPNCGPKVACEAARAGFGEALCRLSPADGDGIRRWRENLSHELRTNESGFFKHKHHKLSISDEFPNKTTWNFYREPTVSSASQLELLRVNMSWGGAVNVPRLREFVADAFDWRTRFGAVKFIRGIAHPLLIRKLLNPDPAQSGEGSALTPASMVVKSICGKRTIFASDGLPELCITYVPLEIVDIHLNSENAGGEVGGDDAADELDLASAPDFDVDDVTKTTSDGTDTTVTMTQRAKQAYDPSLAQKVWIWESLVRSAVPSQVLAWEEQQGELAALASAKAAARAQKVAGGMKPGALDRFVKVKKHGTGAALGVGQRAGSAEGEDEDDAEADLPSLDYLTPSASGLSRGFTAAAAAATAKKAAPRGIREPKRRGKGAAGAEVNRKENVRAPRDAPLAAATANPWTLSKRPMDSVGLQLPRGVKFPTLGVCARPYHATRNSAHSSQRHATEADKAATASISTMEKYGDAILPSSSSSSSSDIAQAKSSAQIASTASQASALKPATSGTFSPRRGRAGTSRSRSTANNKPGSAATDKGVRPSTQRSPPVPSPAAASQPSNIAPSAPRRPAAAATDPILISSSPPPSPSPLTRTPRPRAAKAAAAPAAPETPAAAACFSAMHNSSQASSIATVAPASLKSNAAATARGKPAARARVPAAAATAAAGATATARDTIRRSPRTGQARKAQENSSSSVLLSAAAGSSSFLSSSSQSSSFSTSRSEAKTRNVILRDSLDGAWEDAAVTDAAITGDATAAAAADTAPDNDRFLDNYTGQQQQQQQHATTAGAATTTTTTSPPPSSSTFPSTPSASSSFSSAFPKSERVWMGVPVIDMT